MIRLLPRWLPVLMTGPCLGAPWTLEVLHDFEKPGTQPVAPLVRHGDGFLYGTTSAGGESGLGTLFRVQAGNLETVHHLAAGEGGNPAAGLVSKGDGWLYGSATTGGSHGFGTLFRFQPATGILENLHHFTGGNDGSVPDALMLHSDGKFYGTTRAGGSHGHGTIFNLAVGGTPVTLHAFLGSDGSDPCGPLVFANGGFYGVCRSGGASGLGSAFRIDPAGSFTLLSSFTGSGGVRPGANPRAGLVLHSSGKLAGSTEFGGTHGFGTLFTLTPVVIPVFSTLHHFSDAGGSQPVGRLVEGIDSHLYGCASAGGSQGLGNLFRVTMVGVHTPLHDFNGGDGATPEAGLCVDPAGIFHGVTSAGGPGEMGMSFAMNSAGNLTDLAGFSPDLGFMPSGGPVTDGSGLWFFPVARGGGLGHGAIVSWQADGGALNAVGLDENTGDTPDGALTPFNGGFKGVCARGGSSARGSAFSFSTTAGITPFASFTSSGGSLPEGPLLVSSGVLFGLSREGGASARGSFYRLAASGTRTRIVSFTAASGATPGRTPRGPVALGGNQSFYGAYAGDGATDRGGIFKINPAGAYSQLAAFTTGGPHDPDGGLITAADGFIYGSCRSGGTHGGGALIRIQPGPDTWETVASFQHGVASSPVGDLLVAADGAIFGLTASGHAFRWSAAGGLAILGQASTTGREPDESGLNHCGGLALLPDHSLLATLPGGGDSGGGRLVKISPPPLLSWKIDQLGTADASDLGDPDHDSFSNLVEYALATDPWSADPPLAVDLVDGRLEITLNRDPSRADVTIRVEVCADLAGPWTPLATSSAGMPFTGEAQIIGDAASPGLKSVVIRDTLATSGGSRRFLRLRVDP